MERGSYELSESLCENKFLLYLNLTGNAIGNEGLSYLLPAIAQCNTLYTLNISSNEITSGPLRQTVLRDKMRQGFTLRHVNDTDWNSLKQFKHTYKSDEEEKVEKKRYKF